MPTVPGTSLNPYESTVEDGKRDADTAATQALIPVGGGLTPASDNPYELTLLSRKHDKELAANAAILPALDANPDEYAGHLTLARETGLPVGAVQADPQTIQREQRRNRVIDTISKSPTLQAWTAIDDNAVLAMDDFENLSSLETVMRSVRDVVEAPFKGFDRGLGGGIKGAGDLLDAFAYTADKAVFGEEHATQYLKDAAAAPWWVNPSNLLRGVGGWVEAQAGAPLGEDRRNLATDIGEGFGNLIAQALATRLNPVAGVTLMAGQGADQQAEQADKAGATADQKSQAVILGAGITAASEKLGLDLLLDRLPPNIKNKAAQWIVDKTLAAGIEGTEEAVEQIGNNLVAQMIYDPNNPLFEGVADNATVGAGVGFLARSLLGLRGVGHERQNVASEQTALDGMVTASGASKLLQRAPERFQALVAQMAQAGATHVYVPAEAATKLYQSLEPAKVAEELGVPVETYMEAVITGGDVAIPVEQYLSRVAPQHHDALREVARFTPGAMTPAEAVEMDERAAEAADRFMASVQSEKPSDQMVFDDVSGMLLGTRRYRTEDVERYAQLVQAGFRTLAAREGVDPFALYQRYRLRIKSELPAALQSMDVDTVIDPLIERLRSGDVPKGTKRQSLADFIAAGGGVRDDALAGEIASLHESDRVTRKGRAPLFRKDAERDLDRVREAAAEAGYLPMDSDVNDLLNLLDEEMSGRPTYAMGDEADSVDDRTIAAIESLDEELSRLGIDVSTTSNADIKRALFGETGDQVPDALVQVFDQPGDSPRAGVVAEAKRLGLPATGKTDTIANLVRIAHADPQTWSRADFDAILPYLSVHQDARGNHDADTVQTILRDGLSKGMVDPAAGLEPDAQDRRARAWGKRYMGHDAYVLIGGALKFQGSGNPRLAPGNRPLFHVKPNEGESLFDAIHRGAVTLPPRTEFNQSAAPADLTVTARTKTGEFRLVDKAVPEMAGLQANGWTREIKAFDGAGNEVGSLLYANDGTPPTVEVAEQSRRQGVATAMLKLARQQGGDLGARDTGVTEGGQKSARSEDGQAFREGANEGAVTLFQSAGDQTQTPEFKAWFGDSKVVDAEGKPLVVYHGTRANFDAFSDHNRVNASEGGMFFALDPKVAGMYAGYHEDAYWPQEKSGTVYPVFLSIKNPLIVDLGGSKYGRAEAIQRARDGGHDGLLIKNNDDAGGVQDQWVAFRPEQIKSATANRGTFDPNDTNILHQPADGTPAENAIRRGYIKFGPERHFTVGLLEKADATTFLHETGHFFLEVMGDLAADPLASDAIRSDYAKLLDWFGVLDAPAKLPLVAKGKVRVYTGSATKPAANDPGERWFSTSQDYANGYADKGSASKVYYIDVDEALLERDLENGIVGKNAIQLSGADAAAAVEVPAEIDYAAARARITVEHHEQFARGFEQYLGEGKAPTPELASAFARFKAWVKAIYRTITALNVTLTDDVRGVMDRLLATDEEITQAETSMDYASLFADARSAGWTDAEFATRLTLQEQAREDAESRLMARAMKDVTRETKTWWRERATEVEAEVRAEVEAMPVYRAWARLANGTEPNGTPIEGAGQKLDKAWLVQMYGQEWLNKHLLRKRVYSVTGGADPDVVAHDTGFGSGDEMVQALANMQPMEAVIKAQTHARMVDQYGDVLTDGTMPEMAQRAVHSSKRFRAMEADLKALERLAGDPRPSAAGLRRTAELIIGQKKVRDLQPNTYLRAERKAAKDAIKAAGQQKWGEALEAQRRRLLNAHLFDVASKAVEETERMQRYIKRFEKPKLRARLGKVDRLEQVDALLAHYDLRIVSNKKIDQNKARGELLALIQAGEVIAPPGLVKSLAGGLRTNWRDLTVEELRGLRDVLAQAEAVARAEYEALVNGEKVKLDDVAEQVGASTIDGGKPVMPIYGDLSPDENAKKWGKQMLASWLRPSALARLLDGGKDDGAWTRHVIQPIRRAVSEVLEPMKRKAHEDLAELYRKHYTVKEMAAMNERSVVPGLGLALSRWDVISLALNQGNAENRKAVLDSEVAGKKPYSEAGVRAAMATLDARDWAFVQDAWDLVDSFWPAIKEAQVRRKGIAPPKVEAEPFTVTTRDGQTIDLKGGYYPLKYNGRLDAKARQHEMDEAFERMRAGTLSATQTKYGHTQERVGSGRQPVMLSMTVLHSHINNVIMDLALGDVVNYTDRLLARPQVRQALIETGNLDALDTWKLWLKDTATGEIGARSGADQLAQFIRFGFTKSKVGFNAMTMILQLTGLAQTIPVVGASHTAAAALDFAGRPRAAIKQVMAESAFMRTRYELSAFNKDIAAVQDALKSGAPVGKGSGFLGGFIAAVRAVQMPPRLVNWAFLGIRQMQILVDSTTWLAGYRRAAGEGKSHDEAVRYADGIVENAQTSGMFSDRSAIERGTLTETTRQSEFVKLWTTLMSYMIAKGNIAFESYRRTDFHDPRSILSFGTDVSLLFLAEALLMGLIKGGLPDDDETWFEWTAKTAGQQAISTVPFLREVPGMKYGGGNTPIGSTAGDLYKAVNQTAQGELDQALVKSYINLIGTATGAPSAQINRAVDAYWREDAQPYEYVTGKRQ